MRYSYLWLASLPLATACTRDAPTPPAVSASFTTAAPAEARQPLSFQNTSQNATSYVWNFGDGITAKTANPVHTYTKIGTYQDTAGDSLLLTRLSHLAHYSHSTDYYRSRRRP